ncbi:glycosyltransferase [Thalassomonas sp. M1454]|uniref:glycosyltransferase family 2 protein n=1 Tax=Thalassomonas sp. M1454 TaxID=2594477 RepID=UPI00163DA2D4|nr:glycosyltransferase family 2 protein [Thalassomonas sp. M1454]
MSYRQWLKKESSHISENKLVDSKYLFCIFCNLDSFSNLQIKLFINSLKAQTYNYWQCIIFTSEFSSGKLPFIFKQINSDGRFLLCEPGKQPIDYISEFSSDSYLMCVRSPYVCANRMLSACNNELSTENDIQIVYFDDDLIDLKNRRSNPDFKPDWNLDLLLNQNYIGQSVFFSKKLFNSESKCSNLNLLFSWPILLNISEQLDKSNCLHITSVLGHEIRENKEHSSSIIDSLKSSLLSYFSKLDAEFEIDVQNETARLYWNIAEEPLVSLIIPTYNGYEITKQAIDSILNKSNYSNFEILLVDNNSDCAKSLNYFDKLEKHKKVTVLRYPHPFNYSAINNFAVKYAKGSVIGLINNDVEVINGEWLEEMVSHVIRKDIGCVGAKLYYPNNTIQHAGVIIGLGGCAGHSHKFYARASSGFKNRLQVVQNYSAVTAACLLVRKNVFEEAGGLNEKDLTVAFNDVDFCLKVESLGYRNLWTPYAELYHHESISRGFDTTPEKRARADKELAYMQSKWHTLDYKDPAYNKNLTIHHEDFSIGRN